MQQFLSYFVFDTPEIIGLSLCFVFFVIQIYYYKVYYSRPLRDVVNFDDCLDQYTDRPKVSVIISSENEALCLSENLPLILEQDYPNFEVIVVNNGSTDESYELLQTLKLKYPNLYHTYVPVSLDKKFDRRKLAFTIGIKAAKGDILLFIEPFSHPISNQWISSMVVPFNRSSETKVVLGYSYYTPSSHFYNRVARFDNHIFSMQYLSMALKNKPFTGVYRNVAFKKHMFFDNKGFSAYLGIENGEDIFINQIVDETNTAVALSHNSFTQTALDSFSLWRQIKKTYSVAKSKFKGNASSLFSFEYCTRYIFYLLFLGLSVYSIMFFRWSVLSVAFILFLIRFLVQFIVINKSSKYFLSGKYYLSLITMDILQPIYNMWFRTRQQVINKRR